MNKYFIITIIFLALIFSLPVRAEGLNAVDFGFGNFSAEEAVSGKTLDFFNGELDLTITPNSFKQGSDVVIRKLELAGDSPYVLPDGYKAVTPIFEYAVVNKGAYVKKSVLNLKMKFDSKMRFDKFFFYYNQKKQTWLDLPSKTDLNTGYLSADITSPNLIIVGVDTEAMEVGNASWYRYKGCMCAASPDYPKGTKLLVTNLNKNNETIVVKVNDWGPERDLFPERVIDLDLVAFKKLGTKGTGVFKKIQVLPFHAEDFDPERVALFEAGKVVVLSDDDLARAKTGQSAVAVVEIPIIASVQPITPNTGQYYFAQ